MTVTELLERIIAMYPGANPEAIRGFKPVFLGRLAHREARLEEAANEVFATFQASAKKPFPIPADFEAHMPSLSNVKSEGHSIRQELDDRHQRAASLFSDWHARQGLKIRGARPFSVYAACLLEVQDRCRRASPETPRIQLTPEEIEDCEQRAVTSERAHRAGPIPKNADVWQAQCDEIRNDWQKARAA